MKKNHSQALGIMEQLVDNSGVVPMVGECKGGQNVVTFQRQMVLHGRI